MTTVSFDDRSRRVHLRAPLGHARLAACLAACLALGACSGEGGGDEPPGTGGTPGGNTGGSSSGGSPGPSTGGHATGGVATGGVGETGGKTSATGGAPLGSGGAAGHASTGGAPATGGVMTGGGGRGGATGGSGPGGGAGGTIAPATGGAGGAGPGPGATKSAGCGNTTAPKLDGKKNQSMSVGGKTRYYIGYIPPSYDPETPLPLIFALHGLNMNNWWAANASDGFKLREASNGKALLFYPQGSGDVPKDARQWGDISSSWGTGDYGFIDALVKYVEDNYCVDTSRVFVTGFSMGGMMSNGLGCDRAKVFRAIAPVSGWGPDGNFNTPSCKANPSGTMSAMFTHGTSDGTVNFSSGQASRDFWLKQDGCTTTTTMLSNLPSGPAKCVAYQGCKSGLAVDFCTHSGDHMVPSNTGTNVWAFFSSF